MTTVSTTHEERAAVAQDVIPASTLVELIDAHLYMPFPFRRNPQEPAAAAGVDHWLRVTGLSDEPGVAAMISRTRPAELASYNSPDADPGILQLVAHQIAYQFVFDDRAEEVGRHRPGQLLPMLCESIAVLRDGAPPSTPLANNSSRPIQCSVAGSANQAPMPAPSATGSHRPIRSRSASSRASIASAAPFQVRTVRRAMGV